MLIRRLRVRTDEPGGFVGETNLFECSKCGSRLDLATSWASLASAQRDGTRTAPLRAISQLAFEASCPGPTESG